MLNKIKKNLNGLIHSLIQLAAVIIIGIFTKNIFIIMSCYISFFYFRSKWASQFHSFHCTTFTIIVYLIIGLTSPPAEISLLGGILIAYFTTWVSHIYIDRKELERFKYKTLSNAKEFSKMTRREKLFKLLKNDEEYIENFLNSKNIKNVNNKLSETLYLYMNNTQEDTAAILEISEVTVTKRLNLFLNNF